MSKFKLGAGSRARLKGVHPDLVKVVERAIQLTKQDFVVFEGLRTIQKQREYFNKGFSKTMRSRHLTGHAVDLVPYIKGKPVWSWPHIYPIAEAMKTAANELGIVIEWGGDWRSFKDGPHYQLPWRLYPK